MCEFFSILLYLEMTNPLQYSCLENPMDGGAWWAAVHGVAKSQTRLSNFTFTFILSYCVHVLENLFLVLKYMEISPGCSLEGLMLKLKLQYFGHLMRRVVSLEKTDAGRDWGQEEKGMTEDDIHLLSPSPLAFNLSQHQGLFK